MGNKEIQEQRIKGYFIQATKEILKGEGLKCISVRNVADRAGYSYATLYNYFKDIKELIFECVVDFQNECEEFVKAETDNSKSGTIKIKAIAKAYIKYFVQYPGIFELFFLEKTSEITSKQPTLNLIYSFLNRLSKEEWEYCVSTKLFSAKEATISQDAMNYTVIGMLLFYINRRQPETYKEFSDKVDAQVNSILN